MSRMARRSALAAVDAARIGRVVPRHRWRRPTSSSRARVEFSVKRSWSASGCLVPADAYVFAAVEAGSDRCGWTP